MSIRPRYPFRRAFYQELFRLRPSFQLLQTHPIPAGAGYGFLVAPGQAFRITLTEGPQILDMDLTNADDTNEHYAAGAQFNIEGTLVTRFTRLWGTPARSRPLATVIADSVRWRDNPGALRDHKSYGGHCHPHHWVFFAGRHPPTCYDNLRAGFAMVGLNQYHIHDSVMLFEKMGMDPYTGQHTHGASDAEIGDYIEFFAEVRLIVVLSVCPYGDASVPPVAMKEVLPTVRPVKVEVFETGTEPLAWPYGED